MMKRLLVILRNLFLGLLTLGMLGVLVAADWYVRFDPSRQARRLLETHQVPLSTAGALKVAESGDAFLLEQMELVKVDLGAADRQSGMTPLIASIGAGHEEAVSFLLTRESVHRSLDAAPENDPSRRALGLALTRRDFPLAGRLVELGADPLIRLNPDSPLLVEAFQEQDWELLKFLLSQQIDPDQVGAEGLTPLAMAIGRDDAERVEWFIGAGAEVNVVGASGEPLLRDAVERGDLDLVERLLKAGAEPDRMGASGQSSLLAAVKAGKLELATLLLEHGADPNRVGVEKVTPLSVATAAQDVDLMQLLLEKGADPGDAALLKAAFRNRDLPGINALLRAGASPEVKIGNGRTLLDAALEGESENIARALLGAGASARGKLWSALGTGNEELLKLVLAHGASVGERDPERGEALDFALGRGQIGLVSPMLAHGADPNVKRLESGESWVAAAIREGNEPLARTLIGHGACLEGLKAADGHSLLGWAIARGMKDVVVRLIAEGADVRAREKAPASKEFIAAFERSKTFRWHLQADSKLNPLHLASAQGDVEIAKMLIEAGAKKGEYSKRYLWPVNIAAWHMDVDMMQVILGRDPDPDKQPRKLVVDLGSQRVTLYQGAKAIYNSKISTGKKGYRTPTGTYVITDKHRHHTSSIYGSSMPYFMRLSCAAFGLHEGHVPNYPASHGCIRVPRSGAAHLFSVCEVGDVVEITY